MMNEIKTTENKLNEMMYYNVEVIIEWGANASEDFCAECILALYENTFGKCLLDSEIDYIMDYGREYFKYRLQPCY